MEQFLAEYKTKQSFLQRRDEIIISLLIYQALTNTEIVNLEVKDINLEEGKVHVRNKKGKAKNTNKSRTLALKPKQILLIDRYLNQDHPELQTRLERSRKNRIEITSENLLLTKYGKPIKPAAINRQINHGHQKFMHMTAMNYSAAS